MATQPFKLNWPMSYWLIYANEPDSHPLGRRVCESSNSELKLPSGRLAMKHHHRVAQTTREAAVSKYEKGNHHMKRGVRRPAVRCSCLPGDGWSQDQRAAK